MTKFWFEDFTNIYNDFLIPPTEKSSVSEKINFATQLTIVLSIVLTIVSGKKDFLAIPLVFMMFTVVVFNKKRDERHITKDGKERFKSNLDNPFMNVLITDPRKRTEARKYDKQTKEDIEKNFNTNLYLDSDDMFGRSNSRRQFYTTPNTTIPNKVDELGQWLYGQPDTIFKDEHIEA